MATNTEKVRVVAAALAARIHKKHFAHIERRSDESTIVQLAPYDCIYYMGPKPGVMGAEYRITLYPDESVHIAKWKKAVSAGRDGWVTVKDRTWKF